MKKIVLSIILLIPLITLAQHSSNNQKFKSSGAARTPRYRHETDNIQNFSGNAVMPLQRNEMVLECSVLMNVKADSYLAIFNLTQVGETAQQADELINKRAEAFIQSLSKVGITASDVYSDMIYLIPIFEYETEKRLFSKTYNEVPKGFETQKNIHVRYRKPDLIDDIVTLASANEIYDLVTVEYFVKDSKAIYDSLRTQAIDYISKNAGKLKKTGLNLDGEFRIASENSTVIYPESQYSDYESFVSQSLDAAKNKAVTQMRKPKTVAYNKLPYNNFDIVINPEFLEPVVQFTYHLKVKYILNDEKLQPKNTYFIIDSNGNLKPLQMK